MPATERDDFSAKDKRVLGERAAYICSNPDCRRPTIGPHSDPNASLKTGKACHIKAASSGGPRYDVTQSSDDRRNIQNGIWLCSVCSDLVDKDSAKYTAEKLYGWKREQEERLSAGGVAARIPQLSLSTLHGLSVPKGGGTIHINPEVREHSFIVRNEGNSEIVAIDARVQFPEPIIDVVLFESPVGVHVAFDPNQLEMVFSGSPGATLRR